MGDHPSVERKALVIDDDPDNCDVLRLLLTQLGYQIHSAANGQTGIALADHTFTLAFVDMRLPDVFGAEVVAALRRVGPDTFIVAATMDDTTDTMRAAYAAGCDAFLVKPYDIDQVLHLIGRARRGQRWIADHLGLREYSGE